MKVISWGAFALDVLLKIACAWVFYMFAAHESISDFTILILSIFFGMAMGSFIVLLIKHPERRFEMGMMMVVLLSLLSLTVFLRQVYT